MVPGRFLKHDRSYPRVDRASLTVNLVQLGSARQSDWRAHSESRASPRVSHPTLAPVVLDRVAVERQIDAADRQIDQLVHELHGLTEEEIKIVEAATQRYKRRDAVLSTEDTD